MIRSLSLLEHSTACDGPPLDRAGSDGRSPRERAGAGRRRRRRPGPVRDRPALRCSARNSCRTRSRFFRGATASAAGTPTSPTSPIATRRPADRRERSGDTRPSQPSDPVFLVAKSGGAGVAVKALELLDEETVERVVLLAPALSPGYDLTAALRAVRREIVVFWSPLDVVILGRGPACSARSIASGPSARAWWAFGSQPPTIPTTTRSRQYAQAPPGPLAARMAASGYLRRSYRAGYLLCSSGSTSCRCLRD